MRRVLRKVVNVLDGQPTAMRGQSLVEMAFTFPILILMVLSLVEVGFLANNYLILMDAVRAAGRAAVNMDPTGWNELDTRNQNRMDCDVPEEGRSAHTDTFFLFGNSPSTNDQRMQARGKHLEGLKNPYQLIFPGPPPGPRESNFGFFDEVACQVIRGMTPLLLNDGDITTSKDDVVVSALAFQRVGEGRNAQVIVTGRWPTANRFCGADTRDPFDGNGNGRADNGETEPFGGILKPQNPPDNQDVRGFVFTGLAKQDDGCYGSRFTVQDIQTRVNLDDWEFNQEVPNGGLVIVEVFWQHHPIVLGPLFQGFTGNRFDDPVLWVWGWFPVPSIEPTPTVLSP